MRPLLIAQSATLALFTSRLTTASPECLILAVRDRLLAGEFLQHLVLRGERLPGEWLAMTVIAVWLSFLALLSFEVERPSYGFLYGFFR